MDSARSPLPRDRSPLNAIHARIRRYNSDIDPGSDTFRAAVLLLGGLEYGQNIDVLARRTGIDRSFVAKAARRLIDNGIWLGGRTNAEWGPLDEASGSFWNDVAVGEGKLCRRTLPDGTIEWAPAGFWNKSYHFVDPAVDRSLNTVYFNPGERTADTVPLATERVGGDDLADLAAPAVPAGSAEPVAALPESLAPDASADQQPADEQAGQDDGQAEKPDGEPKPPPPSLNEIFSDAVWIR